MARPNKRLIEALRDTARRIANGAEYRWTHMGSCNCGHLAQTLTPFTKSEIHAGALERRGDWSEQALELGDVERCRASGQTIDQIFSAMFDVGLHQGDLVHLERLSDERVLRRLPAYQRGLDHRLRDDVVTYMRAWADLLEEIMASSASTVETARHLVSV